LSGRQEKKRKERKGKEKEREEDGCVELKYYLRGKGI
jgi:hypothetical protein